MRRLGFIWAVALFFSMTASAQDGGAFDGVYHAWQRPFIAYVEGSEQWLGVYISPDGQAYEYRTKAGALLMVHVRYQGECYQSANGTEWIKRTCHAFIQIDAAFREAFIKHQQQQNARKTEE